jgi:hypothetical protein
MNGVVGRMDGVVAVAACAACPEPPLAPPGTGRQTSGMNQPDDDTDDLYADLERRALFDLPDEEPDEDTAPDLIGSLRGDEPDPVSKDMTLGGYIDEHDRVPAFDGSDGQPYTVDVDVEQEAGDDVDSDDVEGDTPFVAFLVFIRWAATGAGIMDHLESGDVARGRTEAEARQAAMDLSLYEIKAELDAAIERRRAAMEE